MLVVAGGGVGVAGAVASIKILIDRIRVVIHGLPVDDLSVQLDFAALGKRNRHGRPKDPVFVDSVKSLDATPRRRSSLAIRLYSKSLVARRE